MKKAISLLFIVIAMTSLHAAAQVSSDGGFAINYVKNQSTTSATIVSTPPATTIASASTKNTVDVPVGKPSLPQLPGAEPDTFYKDATKGESTTAFNRSMTEELEGWVANQILVLQSTSRRKRR